MTPGGLEPHTSALKGLCPDLLDDGAKTRSLGLEPRPAVLETDMLPITPQPRTEEVGFEPTRQSLDLLVFKTNLFNHLSTLPILLIECVVSITHDDDPDGIRTHDLRRDRATLYSSELQSQDADHFLHKHQRALYFTFRSYH